MQGKHLSKLSTNLTVVSPLKRGWYVSSPVCIKSSAGFKGQLGQKLMNTFKMGTWLKSERPECIIRFV